MHSRNLKGGRFGRLVCIKPHDKNNYGTIWECSCDCGKKVFVNASNLISGNTKSCGCLQKDKAREYYLKHGDCPHKKPTRLYRCWTDMKTRTNNTKTTFAKNYINRGIKLCKQWEKYENFKSWAVKNGYQDGLTLDRINVNGNYCPENCRWATLKQQQRNKRNTLYYKKIPVTELCEKTNNNYHSVMTAVYRAEARGGTRQTVFAKYFDSFIDKQRLETVE